MFSGGWRYVIGAFCLAALVSSGQAQEDQKQPERPSEKQEASANDLSTALPVVVIESEEAAVARQRAEEEARDREQRDVLAQEGMNAATERMAKYALWQTLLIAVGTGALIYTLFLTRQANKAAHKAVDATIVAGEQQSRAFMYVSGGKVAIYEGGVFAQVTVSNAGYSSAIVTNLSATIECRAHTYKNPDAKPELDARSLMPEKAQMKYLVAPTQPVNLLLHWRQSATTDSIREYVANTTLFDLDIWGKIEWTNVSTGKSYTETFSLACVDPASYFTKEGKDRFTSPLFVHQIEKPQRNTPKPD